jgi:predicted MFS family arabinose efflux permease
MKTSWPGVLLGVAVSCHAAYQQFKLPPVLPDLLREFPHSPAIAASFMSIYALIGLLVSQPLGRWLQGGGSLGSGKFGGGLVKGLVIAGILTALGCGLALLWPESAALFLAGRGLEGLGFAICAIAGPAIAAQSAAPRDLPLVTGLLAGWVPIGQIVGAWAAWAVPDWRFPWMLGLGFALILVLVGRYGAKAAARTLPPETLSPRQKRLLWLGGCIFMLWSSQYFAFMTWLTSYLELRYGLSLRESIGAYLLPVVVLLVFNVLTGWALGRGLPLLRSLILGLLSQALVWVAAPYADGWLGGLLLVVYGIGAGVVPTCLFQVPHRIVGGAARAGAFGIVMAARNIGVFYGPLVLALVIHGPEDWGLGFGIFTVITFGSMALAILLRALTGPAGAHP